MSIYKKVLVAVDLRAESKKIVTKAQQMIAPDGEILLLNVGEPIDVGMWAGAPFGSVIVDSNEIENEAKKAKHEKLANFGKKYNIPSENQTVLFGKASREIKLFAEENQCDLIVIGTHGQNGWELLLGSTATGVLHGSPCDVLTVQMRTSKPK